MPKLYALNLTLTGTTPTLNVDSSIATVSRTSAGLYVITLKEPFGKGEICCAASSKTTAHRVVWTANSASTVTVNNYSGAATRAESGMYIFIAGSRAIPTGIKRPSSNLVAPVTKSRLIAAYYDPTADTVSPGNTDFTFTTVSTGIYTVTYKRPAKLEAIPVATACEAGHVTPHITASSISGCTIHCKDGTGAVNDAPFTLMVFMNDSPSAAMRGVNRPVYSTQIGAFFGMLNMQSAAFVVGGDQFDYTTGGTGVYTMDVATDAMGPLPSKRNLVGVASPGFNNFSSAVLSTLTETQAVIETRNSDLKATAMSSSALFLGYQTACET